MPYLPCRWKKFELIPQRLRACYSRDNVTARTPVSAEEYLQMTFEHDAEFVRGELVERGVPNNLHSILQPLLLVRFVTASASPHLSAPRASIATWSGTVSHPGHQRVCMEKLAEYHHWGVPHIWVVDGINQRLSVYTEAGLQHVIALGLPEYSFGIPGDELFASIASV
jgi:hypothetical protein